MLFAWEGLVLQGNTVVFRAIGLQASGLKGDA